MKRLGGVVLACGLLVGLGSGAVLLAKGGEWKEKFGLSDEQAAKLKAAKRANRDAVTPLRDKLEDELEKLRGLVKDGKDEKGLSASLESIKALHKSIRSEEDKFMETAAAALSPLQRAKMLLAMMRHMPHPGMGPGGWGERRGPKMRGHGGSEGERPRADKDEKDDDGEDEDEPR